jgi:hypothetical protein
MRNFHSVLQFCTYLYRFFFLITRQPILEMRLLGLNTGTGEDDLEILGTGNDDGDGQTQGTELFQDVSSLCLDMSHLLVRVSKLALGIHALYRDMTNLLGLSTRGESGSSGGRGSRLLEGVGRVLAMSKLLLSVGKLSLELYGVVRTVGELVQDVRSLGWAGSRSQQRLWRGRIQGRGGAGDGETGSYFLKFVGPCKVVRNREYEAKKTTALRLKL